MKRNLLAHFILLSPDLQHNKGTISMWTRLVRLPGRDSHTLGSSSFLRDLWIPLPLTYLRGDQEAGWGSTYWFDWSAVNIFCNCYSSHSSNHFCCRHSETGVHLKNIDTCVFHFLLLSSVYLKGIEAAMERALAILSHRNTRYRQHHWLPLWGCLLERRGSWEGFPGILWPSICSSFLLLSFRIYPTKE